MSTALETPTALPDPLPFGVYTVATLRSLGWDRAAIDRGLRRGDVRRLRRGVYLVGAVADDDPHLRHLQLTAAALATIGPAAVASHASAARMWELPVLGGPRSVAVTVARATHRVYDGLSVHVARLQPADRTLHLGLPVTSIGRTLVDHTRTGGRRAGVVAADAALHLAMRNGSGAVVVADWDRAIGAARGCPGVVHARWVREHADGRAESPLESLLRLLCAAAELPPLDLQVEVAVDGLRYRLDAVVRGTWVAIECDGRVKYRAATLLHTATVEDRVWEDRQRDWFLAEMGWAVVHVTWEEVTRRPETVARRVREAISRSGRLAESVRTGR